MLIFNVRNQNISRIDNFSPAEKSENYLEAQFNFKTDDWQGVTKTAVFENAKTKVIKDVILVNDKCLVPWEVLEGNSSIKVSVYGVSLSEKITTDIAEFRLNSTLHGGSATTEPTPDAYQQIIDMLDDIAQNGVTDEQIEKAVEKYLAENPIGGVDEAEVQRIVAEYVEKHKEELKGDKGESGADGKDGIAGKDGRDGFSPTATVTKEGSVSTLTVTDKNGTTSVKILDGKDGVGGSGGSGEGESTVVYNNSSYRWQYVEGIVHPNSMYNYKTKVIESAGPLYACVQYILNGEKKIRFSGATSGGSTRLAYAFVDENRNVVSIPEFVKGERFIDAVLDVPQGAYELLINGNNYTSAHLEIAVEDLMADSKTLPYLLNEFGKRLQYKETFAWKPMDTGYIAFTFDDSLEDVGDIVDIFVAKGVPCCFGAIPEKLNMGLANGETIAQAMKRGVETVGCEVLAHGSSATEIVVEDNIDDMNFLYNKFVVNKQKLLDCGFDVRGTVRVGGSGNICGDPRTDEWVRLFFDYGDLYGVNEPHSHPRLSISTGLDGYKSAIDEAIEKKEFMPILFHACPDYIGELIDYVIFKGGVICNYATVYDTFGSTQEMVSIDNRLKAIENIANGNEVDY